MEKKTESKICKQCNRRRSIDKFIANSQWCTPCRQKHLKTVDDLEKFCDKFYIPFNVDIWNDIVEKNPDNEKKAIGVYFRSMNLRQNKNDIQVEEDNNKEEDNEVYEFDYSKDFEVTQDMIIKWGSGYKKEHYWFLEKEWDKLVSVYESDSPVQRMLYEEIAKVRLDIRLERENKGKNVDKLMKTLQDLLGSSNIKPVQETGANSTDQATFGTLIKKWEEEEPIPEPLEEFKDVDGVKKYIEVWFLGHFCKMLNIKNSYSEMYEQELAKYTVSSSDLEGDD